MPTFLYSSRAVRPAITATSSAAGGRLHARHIQYGERTSHTKLQARKVSTKTNRHTRKATRTKTDAPIESIFVTIYAQCPKLHHSRIVKNQVLNNESTVSSHHYAFTRPGCSLESAAEFALLPNCTSISSSVFPRVSGMNISTSTKPKAMAAA